MREGENNNEGTELNNLSNKIEERFVNETAQRIYNGHHNWTLIKNNIEFKNIPRNRIRELQRIATNKAASMQLQLMYNRGSLK